MTPVRAIVPSSGSASPESVFIRVVFPAPLRPTSPTLSPACKEKDAPEINGLAPAEIATSRAMIMLGLRGWWPPGSVPGHSSPPQLAHDGHHRTQRVEGIAARYEP